MKKTPGPLAPPESSLPSLKMTALSYSWTTFTTKRRERGRETTMSISDPIVMMRAQIPGPSSQTEITSLEVMLVSNVITEDHLPQHAIVNMVSAQHRRPHHHNQMELYCLVPPGGTNKNIVFICWPPPSLTTPHTTTCCLTPPAHGVIKWCIIVERLAQVPHVVKFRQLILWDERMAGDEKICWLNYYSGILQMHWEDCNGWWWDMIGPCPGNTLHQTPWVSQSSQRNKRNQWWRYDSTNHPITLCFIRTTTPPPPTVTEEIYFPQTGVDLLSLETGIIIFKSFYLSAVMATLCLW